MRVRKIVYLVVLMGILSCLFGCGKNKNQVNVPTGNPQAPAHQTKDKEPEVKPIVPIELPEGTKLTGMYLNQQGMMKMPYYIMKSTESGTYMKITDLAPDDYEMWKDADTDSLEQPAAYFGFVESVIDIEYASLIHLEDESLIRQLEELVEKYGVLAWDGFHESDSMPGVLDSGNSYNLYLEFSDGTTVTVDGYNAAPKGFHDFYSETAKIFQNNSDYSRYLATDFSASPCTLMEVELREKEYSNVCYQISLRANTNQWSVILTDPVGLMLEKGTDISDYKESETPLPFERFLGIMSKYDVESWNQYDKTDSASGGKFDITVYFEDGKEFRAHGNVYPEGFEEFKAEFVKEICDFYKEIQ